MTDDPEYQDPTDPRRCSAVGPGFESQLKLSVTDRGPRVTSCYCVGPQGAEPLCPCRMRAFGVVKRGGRWVVPERDLGPVRSIRSRS